MSGDNKDEELAAQAASTAESEDYMRMVPVDELYFDPHNPRLPHRVDGTDQRAVLEWMLQDASLVELMTSIATVGFFRAEPLLVTPREGGGYTVLEGNRRLAATKILRDPTAAPTRRRTIRNIRVAQEHQATLDRLPCIIFADPESVQDYLGYRHVTGVKEWEPAAKARYLERLYDVHAKEQGQEIFRHLARIIGSRSDYVQKLLTALKVYEIILDESDISEPTVPFSLITLALNYTEIRTYIQEDAQSRSDGLNRARVKELGDWLFGTGLDGTPQLGDSRNMRLLARAIQSDAGRSALREGSTVADAAMRAVDRNQLSRTYLEHAVRDLDAFFKLTESESALDAEDEGAREIRNLLQNARVFIVDALSAIEP